MGIGETKRGVTLWELFRNKLTHESEEREAPPELKLFNPLRACVNDFVTIEWRDLFGVNLKLMKIDVYTRRIEGKEYKFTDYILRDGDRWVTLRIIPIEDADPNSVKHSNTLVLSPDREFEYEEQLHKEVLPAGILTRPTDEGTLTYNRVNGLRDPFSATVVEFEDAGKPMERTTLDYWDFARTLDGGGIEFYYVEMNKETGFMQTFVGYEVPEHAITLLPATSR